MKVAACMAVAALAAPALGQTPYVSGDTPWQMLQQGQALQQQNQQFMINAILQERARRQAAQEAASRAAAQQAYANDQTSRDQAAAEDSQTQKAVGTLIADGRCDDARDTALRAGRFDLAQNVGKMCNPADGWKKISERPMTDAEKAAVR